MFIVTGHLSGTSDNKPLFLSPRYLSKDGVMRWLEDLLDTLSVAGWTGISFISDGRKTAVSMKNGSRRLHLTVEEDIAPTAQTAAEAATLIAAALSNI